MGYVRADYRYSDSWPTGYAFQCLMPWSHPAFRCIYDTFRDPPRLWEVSRNRDGGAPTTSAPPSIVGAYRTRRYRADYRRTTPSRCASKNRLVVPVAVQWAVAFSHPPAWLTAMVVTRFEGWSNSVMRVAVSVVPSHLRS